MIRQLQKRFIRIAVIALTVAMVLVVGIVNIANWISVRNDLSGTLVLLEETRLPAFLQRARQEGSFPPPEDKQAQQEKTAGDKSAPDDDTASQENTEKSTDAAPAAPGWVRSPHFRNMISESNWFSGFISPQGKIRVIRTDRMKDLDEESAKQLVAEAAAGGKTEGFIRDYLFRIRENPDGSRTMMLLDCETRLAAVRRLVLCSAVACAGGILLAWLLVSLASRKAVEPTIRNMEQQKQFITNASHELKTPLTVISTNMELLSMETDDNPWVRSTQKQTAALSRLVDELVYLSRMEEENSPLEMERLDAGRLLEETAEPFAAMAEFNGLEMRVTAERDLRMTGDRASIQRLISTLCDNAVKYASGSPIAAEIRSEGKNVLLRVSNPVEEALNSQECEQLFNRFYRVDPSRNKEKKGGFGIGLAIAAAIAEKHGGRISAAMEDNRLVFTCLLPKETK